MKHAWIHLVLQCCTVIIISNGDTVKNLTGIEGGAITFPQSVVGSGFLIYGVRNIAFVSDDKTTILENYWKDKVQWNSTTGFFTITGLLINNSGRYSVNVPNRDSAVYDLTVFEPVSIPLVSRVNDTESCTLLCEVEKPAQTPLCWRKDGKIIMQSNSSQSLLLNITGDFSSLYICEASNPADAKFLKANLSELCSDKLPKKTDSNKSDVMKIVITKVLATLALLTVGLIFRRRCFKRDQGTEVKDTQRKEPEVVYSDISIVKNQGRQSPRPVQPVDENNLTTIYSKLEVHNMTREAPC